MGTISRQGFKRRLAVLLCLALMAGATAHAQFLVRQIVITNVGPSAASEPFVRANIRTKTGEPYSRTSIDDDVRNLYATGFFYNIQVAEQRSAEGVNLTYVLKGRPKITELTFVGNKKYSNSKLTGKVSTKLGDPLDERKLFMDAQEIKKMYQQAGYPKTEVSYDQPDVKDDIGQASVKFRIVEAPKVKVDDVYFEGAKAFSQKKLRKVVKTRRHWMFSWLTGSGVLKDDQLEDDKDRLADFYRGEGYIDFELREVKTVHESARKIRINFVISEGKQYRVGNLAFKGVSLFPTNDLTKQLKMTSGSTFTPRGLNKDMETIQTRYGTKGYIDTRVMAQKQANTQTGNMDVTYDIEEGNKSFVEKIEIKGNTKTKDRVIRRELAVSPGEVFDMTKVDLSKQRLEGTALFNRVDAQPEPTTVPDRKNLVISVDEADTAHISFGAGFSSIDSLLGFIEYREGNFQLPWFRGGGQKFRLRAALGSLRREFQATFIEPWFLERKLEFSVDAYHRELDYVSVNDLYNERRTGVRFGLRRAFTDHFIGGVNYTLENIGIVDVSPNAPNVIKEEEGDRLVSKIGTTLAYDTRKYQTAYSGFLPIGGQQTEFRAELAGGPLGAETDFYKFDVGTAWYFKGFAKGHVFEVGGRIGTVEAYGDSETVPFYDRFFLGGLDTLRGYKYREVGPYDISGGVEERVGGNTYWFGSIEYSVPVIEFVRAAVFYDVGMVYPGAFSFDPQPGTGFYNDNWGVGLRLNIPRIGPLRLDYGIPIKSDALNDSSGRFQFSVGYTREF